MIDDVDGGRVDPDFEAVLHVPVSIIAAPPAGDVEMGVNGSR